MRAMNPTVRCLCRPGVRRAGRRAAPRPQSGSDAYEQALRQWQGAPEDTLRARWGTPVAEEQIGHGKWLTYVVNNGVAPAPTVSFSIGGFGFGGGPHLGGRRRGRHRAGRARRRRSPARRASWSRTARSAPGPSTARAAARRLAGSAPQAGARRSGIRASKVTVPSPPTCTSVPWCPRTTWCAMYRPRPMPVRLRSLAADCALERVEQRGQRCLGDRRRVVGDADHRHAVLLARRAPRCGPGRGGARCSAGWPRPARSGPRRRRRPAPRAACTSIAIDG